MVASGVGYYGTQDNEDRLYTESDESGQGFLAEVCEHWEAEAQKLESYAQRVVRLGLGVVLGANGGLIQRLQPIFRCFLGGHLGDGKQFMPWISQTDVNAICLYVAEHDSINGPINVVAVQHISNDQCMRAICKKLHRPCCAHIPTFVVKLLFGQMGREMLLSSMRVEPRVLLQDGYIFKHSEIESCLSSMMD
ncbi:MAG: DUF1731 domain-containing protein [Planctomycetes bacterium]|nr:DUF1731 domain-containing protein [Planctomycetota bacterium]